MTTIDDAADVVKMGSEMNEEVLGYLEQMKARSDESIAALETSYSSVISRMQLSLFVDAVNGDDNRGNGTNASPFKTIQKAVQQSPFGSFLKVILKTDIHLTEKVHLDGITILITSDGSIERKISFERKSQVFNNINYRFISAFVFKNGGDIIFNKIFIDFPVLDGNFSSTTQGIYAHIISYTNLSEMKNVFVKIYNCTMNIPQNSFGSLIGFSELVYHQKYVILPSANYKGRILSTATDTAGTAVSSISGFVSNLTDI